MGEPSASSDGHSVFRCGHPGNGDGEDNRFCLPETIQEADMENDGHVATARFNSFNIVEFIRQVRNGGSNNAVLYQAHCESSPRHRISDGIGECSTSSSPQAPFLAVLDMSFEVVNSREIKYWLFVFHAFPSVRFFPMEIVNTILPGASDILGTVSTSCCKHHDTIEKATRCFMTLLCRAAEKSGGYEKFAMYVERVVEELKEVPSDDIYYLWLLVFLIIRCAKALLRFGSRFNEVVRRVCVNTNKIVQERQVWRQVNDLMVGLSFIYSVSVGLDTKFAETFPMDSFIEKLLAKPSETICDSEFEISLLTGFFRETHRSDDLNLNLEIVEDILKKSLDCKNVIDDVSKRASICITLAKYYLKEEHTSCHDVCRNLLEAISKLRSANCLCPRYSMRSNYYEEVVGATECPRHVLLADALMYEGIVLSSIGSMQKAKKSFEEGMSLVERDLSDDKERLIVFNHRLQVLQMEMAPTNFKYSPWGYYLHRLNAPGYRSEPLNMRNLPVHIGLDETFKKLLANDRPLLEIVKEYVERVGFGDPLTDASLHTFLCHGYSSDDNEAGWKKHLRLAVEALDKFSQNFESSKMNNWQSRREYLQQLMTTGHFALAPPIMELDHARNLFRKAYQFTQLKLYELVQVSSEEDVVRYFETSKHVSAALAYCEQLRARQLWHTGEQPGVECNLAAFRSLMWAERGKEGMLSILFEYGNQLGPVEHTMSGCRTNNLESAFMANDEFALDVLSTELNIEQLPLLATNARQTVFVEYTLVSQIFLQIIIRGRGGIFPFVVNLSKAIDEEDQLEAEEELLKAEVLLKEKEESSCLPTDDWNQLIRKMTGSNTLKGNSSEANGKTSKVLSALYTSEVNRAPFNRWIPGMVAGIQRRAEEAQQKRIKERDFKPEEEKIEYLLLKLYAVLIKPIEEALRTVFLDPNPKGDNTIVFIPHEDLGVVPFAGLHEKNSPYLIEQYAISVSPSIRRCRRMKEIYEHQVTVADSEPGLPLLVGRINGYPVPFGPLAEAHKEVDIVGQALGPTSYLKFVDDDTDPDMKTCMKERVMNEISKASWVHLSVHGEISPRFPQGSLVFGNDDNQRLSAAEIIYSGLYSSTWSARCVIASACQSGLGSVAGGGIMGFARAFMLAGVPSSILSMWEVNQTFCTTFMGKLYVELRSRKDIAEAVQRTTTSMIREFRQQPEKKLRVRRFKRNESGGLPTPERVRKWSILDWAAFSCFGFPGVKLPDSVTVISGFGTSS